MWLIESIWCDVLFDYVVVCVVVSLNVLLVVDDDGCYCGLVDCVFILKVIMCL